MAGRRILILWSLLALGLSAAACDDGAVHRVTPKASATDGARSGGDGSPADGSSSPGPTPAADSAPGISPCNDGEAYFEGYCYAAVGMGKMTWEMAVDACQALGSEPASIHSEEENQLAFDLLYMWTECAWIGLGRDSGGDDFAWGDGSPVDFTAWQSGEPDDDVCGCIGGPYASADDQLRWRDARCGEQLREIVCEREP